MLSAPTRSARATFASQARALSYTAVANKPHFESHSSQPSQPPPHYAPQSSQSPGSPAPRRSRLSSPAPRPTPAMEPGMRVPVLPPQFGRNQVLEVPDRTRALLEEIAAGFDAPIRYAFAYGSGVFNQDGYKDSDRPQLDFLFAVTHADHFHSINMQQNPKHYALVPRLLGSDFVARTQSLAPGLWFNPYVRVKDGVTIKYGVTTVDNLCADLLGWKSLYMAGRMHKPIRIIKDDPRVRLTQQVNLTSAVRAALLTLPERFNEKELFERIAGISYAGDPRMSFAENPHKVRNIVNAQQGQFRELYHRLVVGLPGVHWAGEKVEQDASPQARGLLLRKLPSNLRTRIDTRYQALLPEPAPASPSSSPTRDENVFWQKIGAAPDLRETMQAEMAAIIKSPATRQSVKGLVTAGPIKSLRYAGEKIGKWWNAKSS
ncbi:Mitochondrial translocator assembly and maintenance protein 41 homolog Short=TAM41 [Rhizoctonia solani AG-1 IB]|uniref:Phosphatidate cytidylyltransferase, mitochondrial n=1 Tax=Thanatephorus cucumeris (strain AG1-IB / isolate 7/3/14) TaxID=1108050 RepID=M5BIJ2_THACB|nr:Mitochondrial translocator assembly and maintenance protein 41 homolog Short=TAM41 [Rhizoctonia solani AG-1 IB]